jgi:hypothetical protein
LPLPEQAGRCWTAAASPSLNHLYATLTPPSFVGHDHARSPFNNSPYRGRHS